jgi:hypothetical protein
MLTEDQKKLLRMAQSDGAFNAYANPDDSQVAIYPSVLANVATLEDSEILPILATYKQQKIDELNAQMISSTAPIQDLLDSIQNIAL